MWIPGDRFPSQWTSHAEGVSKSWRHDGHKSRSSEILVWKFQVGKKFEETNGKIFFDVPVSKGFYFDILKICHWFVLQFFCHAGT